jgi:UDP:flavonoid glycosyltransferase YjiC (YdhE family)
VRVLLSVRPFHGHVHPLIPFARSIVKRGHSVAFATHRTMSDVITGAGLQWYPAGLHPSTAGELFPDESGDYGQSALTTKAVDLVDLSLTSFATDLIVRDPTDLGAALAAEALGIPSVTFGIGHYIPRSSWKKLTSESMPIARQSMGLVARAGYEWLNRWFYVDPLPPSFESPMDVKASRILHVRYRPWDGAGRYEVPAWLQERASGAHHKPLVLVTLGTVYNAPDYFAALLAALASEPVEVICTLGSDVDPATIGRVPDNVRLARYIPQSRLTPHCAAVVSHVGFNTALGAMADGVPVVCVPIGSDQFHNASKIVEANAGIQVEGGDRTEPAAVREAVRRVLEDESYRAGALRVRAEMRSLPPYSAAVKQLERLASRGVDDRALAVSRFSSVAGQ